MSIYERLFDWQKKIINKFKEKKEFGLFLDMGLGKTPISLSFTEANNCTKIIIITLNSKVNETITEKGSWLNWLEYSSIKYNYNIKKINNKMSNKTNDVLLINYESLFNHKSKLNYSNYSLNDNIITFIKNCKNNNVALIIDESHKIKNLQSIQTKMIFKIKSLLSLNSSNLYIYLLSGTPFTTGYIDLYAQLKLLGYNMNKSIFVDNYCIKGQIPGLLGWQQPIIGYKNINELFNLIHQYALTIKSEDVINLPNKIYINHTYNQSNDFILFTSEKLQFQNNIINKQFAIYKNDNLSLSKINNPYFRNIDYPSQKWISDTNGSFWLRARQLSIGFQGNKEEAKWFDRTRLNKLKEFLKDNEDNYVLFYNFTPELLEIYDICDELGYNIDIYCGEIKSLTFYNNYCCLNENEKLTCKKNIILSNYASGSTGMNWQEYNKCILFSLPLYKDYEQSLKRIHRIGQSSTVFYHSFYQKNWLDYSMKSALEKGIQYNEKMFEDDLPRVKQIIYDRKEDIQ